VVVCHDISSMLGQKETPLLHVWMHSQFMQAPPSAMGGEARALSDDECNSRKLPLGTLALKFRKKEIDGAAKDTKHTNFDHDFTLEVFWKYIPDALGTGESLAACVEEAPQDSALKFKNGTISTYQKDKDEYLTDSHQRATPRTIEDFLLYRDEGGNRHGEEAGGAGQEVSSPKSPGQVRRDSRGWIQARNHSAINLLAEVSKVHKARTLMPDRTSDRSIDMSLSEGEEEGRQESAALGFLERKDRSEHTQAMPKPSSRAEVGVVLAGAEAPNGLDGPQTSSNLSSATESRDPAPRPNVAMVPLLEGAAPGSGDLVPDLELELEDEEHGQGQDANGGGIPQAGGRVAAHQLGLPPAADPAVGPFSILQDASPSTRASILERALSRHRSPSASTTGSSEIQRPEMGRVEMTSRPRSPIHTRPAAAADSPRLRGSEGLFN